MTRTLLLALALAAPAAAAPPPVSAVAYRPDDKLLAAGTRGNVHLIDPAKGDVRADLAGQTGRVTAVAFARSGQLAVASGEPGKSGVIRLYDTRDLKTLKPLATFTAHTDAVYGLAFTPDGQTLATAGYDKLIKLWALPLGEKPTPRLTLTDHSDAVYALDFHHSGRLLASGSADRTVKVWDVATGKRLYTLGEPTDTVHAVAWSPDNLHLAAGSAEGSIRVWTATEKVGSLIHSVPAHSRPVSRVAFTADGNTLVSVGEDRVLKLWNPASLDAVKTVPAQPDDVLAFAVRPDGKQLAVGLFTGQLRLLDPATGKPTATPLPAKPRPPAVTRLSPDHTERGRTVRVRFEGQRLDTVTGIRASGDGVSVAIDPATQSSDRLEAAVTATAEATIGVAELVLTSEGGDAKPARVWIDRFPAVQEHGQTDSARLGMPVKLPVTVVGTLDRAGDGDFYRFEAAAKQEIGVQVTTIADGSKFGPVVVLTDEVGRVLAEGTAGLLGYTTPQAGTYSVGIRDRDFRGGAELSYRLHVGPVPVITGVFALGVTRGHATAVTLTGVNLGGRTVTVSPPADADVGSNLPVPLTRRGGDPVGEAAVTVAEFPAVEVRAGSTTELPAVPATADGTLATPGESHTIRFHAKKGQRLVAEVHAARLGSPVDSFIEVLDATGQPVPQAVLRSTARTTVTFRDHDATKPGIRLEHWNELAIDDLLYVNGELMRIRELPPNPDADCQFYEVGGDRVGLLGTTPTHHAQGTPMYRVQVHPPGSSFPPNGLPVFELAYRNDDGGPGHGKDSRVVFDPPADGDYQVRVSDAGGAGGPTHSYRLTVRPPRPDFTVALKPTDPKVWEGGAVPITVTATRLDGFDGPIDVTFPGLPKPLSAPATQIEARQHTTAVTLSAGTGPVPDKLPPLRAVATATINGQKVTREATGKPPAVVKPGDLATTTNLAEVVIRPGSEARLVVKVERRDGLKGRVPLDVRGLPHGVRVLDIGLNGILVLPEQTQREVVIYAEPWVQPMERPFVVLSRSERKGTEHAAPPVALKVVK